MRAGVRHFDAIAAGLIDVEEEGLLDRVLVRAGLDEYTVFKKMSAASSTSSREFSA